jgi:hypothetical protein
MFDDATADAIINSGGQGFTGPALEVYQAAMRAFGPNALTRDILIHLGQGDYRTVENRARQLAADRSAVQAMATGAAASRTVYDPANITEFRRALALGQPVPSGVEPPIQRITAAVRTATDIEIANVMNAPNFDNALNELVRATQAREAQAAQVSANTIEAQQAQTLSTTGEIFELGMGMPPGPQRDTVMR